MGLERVWLRRAGAGLLAGLLCVPVWAQGGAAKDGAGAGTPPPGQAQDEANHPPLTKQQAKELFKSVDEILRFVSADTKLPIEHTVKRRLMTRDEVNKFLRQKFDEDQGTKRLERSEVVLKKFGMLDRDFNLRPFLISLLTEQVAGFYDNKTKTVNLLDWIEPEEQKPVLAHELTHALQDQKVDLTKWSEVGSDEIAKNVEEDNRHIQTDEADTARDAVTEGQAMVVFLDYGLRSTGKTLEDIPNALEKKKDALSDTSGSPVLARAPLLLQRSLLFPYDDGLSFEDAILLKQGREAAFAGTLARPPASTFEVMHPAAYMAHTPVPVLRMPDIHPLIDADYMPYDVGVMGEFDVRVLAELFGGREMGQALAEEWNGGIYYAAQKKGAADPGSGLSTASIGLLYESKWKDEDSARTFMRVYAGELPRKYSGLERRRQDEKDADEQVYSTSEGDVLLSRKGAGVFVSEGFPLALARKLRDAIVSVQVEGPMQLASSRKASSTKTGNAVGAADIRAGNDPGMELVKVMSSMGVMKAVIENEGVASGRYTLISR